MKPTRINSGHYQKTKIWSRALLLNFFFFLIALLLYVADH